MFLRAFIFFLFPLFSFCNLFALSSLQPSYAHSRSSKPLIFLDPGHGGLELGAKIKYPHIEEKRLALSTALLVKKYLDQLGYRVILTRSTDVLMPLLKRVEKANKSSAEIFVSLHFNSCSQKNVHGIEIYYSESRNKKRSDSSRKLGESILKNMVFRTNSFSRGVKKGNFCVIRETSMASVLVEGGFLTNPAERSKLRERQFQEKLAKGIAEGIDKYFRIK